MSIALIGATGNTGAYLARALLDQGETVIGFARRPTAIVHDRYCHVQGDIRNPQDLERLPESVDTVVNFSGVQPSILSVSETTDFKATIDEYLSVNIVGGCNVLNLVRDRQVATYIFATSHRDLEGYWGSNLDLTTDLPPKPNLSGDHAAYGVSKLASMYLGEIYGKQAGFRVVNLRLPMIFLIPDSPFFLRNGQPEVMPFLKLIRAALRNDPLDVWGDPALRRDYVHVDNLVQMVTRCLEMPEVEGTFNVGTGEGVTTERFVRTVGEFFAPEGDPPRLVFRPDINTYKNAVYDLQREQEVLGYRPLLLNEMLRRLRDSFYAGDYGSRWGWW